MKIKSFVPIYAHAEFECEAPEGWSEMSDEEKKDYFMDHAEKSEGLCHQCASAIETDYEPAYDFLDEIEFHED